MDWMPVLNVTLPVASALGAVWLTNRHTRKMAAADREAAADDTKEQRRFEARERRHDDRREAVVSLMDASQDYTVFTGMHAKVPSELTERRNELAAKTVYALSRVAMLCPEEVTKAAQEMMNASDELPSDATSDGTSTEEVQFRKALRAYRDACRTMLSEDDRVTNRVLSNPPLN
jgi:hypothetical protein